eukprot:COSAG01_NODE_75093_length_198_cov_53.151515_1_plen_51_part_10
MANGNTDSAAHHAVPTGAQDATAEDPKTAYFSVLDLSKAFYTLPIHPESKW